MVTLRHMIRVKSIQGLYTYTPETLNTFLMIRIGVVLGNHFPTAPEAPVCTGFRV